jgi:hypothetical protein
MLGGSFGGGGGKDGRGGGWAGGCEGGGGEGGAQEEFSHCEMVAKWYSHTGDVAKWWWIRNLLQSLSAEPAKMPAFAQVGRADEHGADEHGGAWVSNGGL